MATSQKCIPSSGFNVQVCKLSCTQGSEGKHSNGSCVCVSSFCHCHLRSHLMILYIITLYVDLDTNCLWLLSVFQVLPPAPSHSIVLSLSTAFKDYLTQWRCPSQPSRFVRLYCSLGQATEIALGWREAGSAVMFVRFSWWRCNVMRVCAQPFLRPCNSLCKLTRRVGLHLLTEKCLHFSPHSSLQGCLSSGCGSGKQCEREIDGLVFMGQCVRLEMCFSVSSGCCSYLPVSY